MKLNTQREYESAVTIKGPEGDLEALMSAPEEIDVSKVAIICHPHPLHGGTMSNKVVTALVRTFRELGLHTVRFNFRGVGNSAGKFGHAIGESEDLMAVLAWVKDNWPDKRPWLAGFSFGSYVAANVANQSEVDCLISIAPPVNNNDFEALTDINCPWIVVQGGQDEIVPAEKVYQWVKHHPRPPQLIKFDNTGHFFHGHLVELRAQLKDALSPLIES